MVMTQKFIKFTHRGKDREKVQDEALKHLNEFCTDNEVIHFQISEAQVIDGPGMAMPGMQGLAVTPSFELTVYVLYKERCDCCTEKCYCSDDCNPEREG